MSEADTLALADAVAESAKPVAMVATFTAATPLHLWLVARALEAAMSEFVEAVALEAGGISAEEADRIVRAAADRILAGWRDSEQRLDFGAALDRATQRGGAA